MRVVGSSVGTHKDLEELVAMTRDGALNPVVEVFPFKELPEVLQKVKHSKIQGRAVVTSPD